MKNRIDSRYFYSAATFIMLTVAAFASMSLLAATVAQASNVETVLYSFSPTSDGAGPLGNLIRDAAGNLYGVTNFGGAINAGAVFELTPQRGGGWVEKILYSFKNNPDGLLPSGGLAMDRSGSLYGVTQRGGTGDWGSVYQLTPDGNGNWTETILRNFFSSPDTNGNSPFGTLTLDAAGNLYGTTTQGGRVVGGCSQGCGLVFELSPPATKTGSWRYRVLHRFLGPRYNDGQYPNGDLLFDAAGNLFGTTLEGGSKFWGTVFELTPGPTGWTEKVLYNFLGSPSDGGQPEAGLIFDAAGNLYGPTSTGGVLNNSCSYGCGTVFELSPSKGGWTEKVLHAFTGGADGAYPGYAYPGSGSPYGARVTLHSGNLYGTTSFGGNQPGFSGDGVVFKLSPSGGTWTERVLHTFTSSPDGKLPLGGVIFDPNGNLYGTTFNGGAKGNDGIVYQISR
jgi:uncharacterized repeat protein (TIGR03803 family)